MEEVKENDSTLRENLDFTKPDFKFMPKDKHTWRQQGPYVVCKTCGLEHASYIGMEKIMTGIDENGMPILTTRS